MQSFDTVYLNTAACGLVSPKATAAGMHLYTQFAADSSVYAEQWKAEEENKIRDTLSAFLEAPAESIAMIPNFSFGMNCVVQSLKGTEKVLLYRQDYPSLTEPFIINHFDITWIDAADDGFTINMETLAGLIAEKAIDLVAISHVQWLSGFKMDLEKLAAVCRKYDVILLIDGTQSLGAMPIRMAGSGIDVFIASNYKWMNAGFGTGIMYLTETFLKKYPPVVGGNNSYRMQAGKWMYAPSVHSYEPGHLNMFGFNVLAVAVRDKLGKGLDSIGQHNMQLTEYLLDSLDASTTTLIGPPSLENRSSIIFLQDKNGLGDWLRQHRIIVTHRNGNLRISMHYYNTQADIDALIQCIRMLPGSGRQKEK